MPQVPTGDISKSVKFQAAYTSLTFNSAKDAFYRISGVLDGMKVSSIGSSQVEIKAGAFIQAGIVVDLAVDFLIPFPALPFPWSAIAVTDDEVPNSPTTISIVETASVPVGVIVLATTDDGVTWVQSKQISIKSIRAELTDIEQEVKVRRNRACNAGFELINPTKGTNFPVSGRVMDCWSADFLVSGSSEIDVTTDPALTRRGGAAVNMKSLMFADPGGTNPDGGTRPAANRSKVRIWQTIEGYEDFLGEAFTLSVFLRLPPSQAAQLHDLEIAIYGSNNGAPGFSDTAVDKVGLVIPAGTLRQVYQQFTVSGSITNLNAGLVAAPLPATPGISIRIAYVHQEPTALPLTTDEVLIDDVMLYSGTIANPVFFPIPRAVDWLRAEELFESQTFEMVGLGGQTDVEYRMGKRVPFRGRKRGIPTVAFQAIEVVEDGQTANNEAAYGKAFSADSAEEFTGLVSKAIGGFRPARVKALVRIQA